jgi:uncharacterized protein (DUF983 family)
MTIVIALACIVDALFHPAPWMHPVLWIPASVLVSLWALRPFGATLIALQHRAGAGAGQGS